MTTDDPTQRLLQRLFDPLLGVERAPDGSITKLNGPASGSELLFSCCDHCGCCDDCGRPREGHDDTCQHGCNDSEATCPTPKL